MKIRRVPPLLLCAFAAHAQRFLGGRRPARPAVNVVALAIVTGSTSMFVAPVAAFRRAGTTVDPRENSRAKALVTGGTNAISKKPMYVGMVGLLVAPAVSQRSVRAAVSVLAFAVWIDRVQTPEESHLPAHQTRGDLGRARAVGLRPVGSRPVSPER